MKINKLTVFKFIILLTIFIPKTFAQLGVNETGALPATNAILDVKSASKGMLIPRITTTNRNALSGEGMVVFDPFMGSGTTGIACKNMNRSFIGIEMIETNFLIAKNRIESHTVQSDLF